MTFRAYEPYILNGIPSKTPLAVKHLEYRIYMYFIYDSFTNPYYFGLGKQKLDWMSNIFTFKIYFYNSKVIYSRSNLFTY